MSPRRKPADQFATHCLTALAEGQRVLYLAHRSAQVETMVNLIEQAAPSGLISRVYRARGRQRITATNGGEVIFRVSGGSARGYIADTLLLDGVTDKVAVNAWPAIAFSKNPTVHRRVRP